MAMSRCGKLKHIFASPLLSLSLKIRLYKAAVCSVFTYGCETWDLNEKTMRMINGANSRMLSHITGNSARSEARPQTTTFNLVQAIRIRRYRWLGHILRSPKNRLIHRALAIQLEINSPGNLFLDAPAFSNMDHLREQAMDRAGWQGLIGCVLRFVVLVVAVVVVIVLVSCGCVLGRSTPLFTMLGRPCLPRASLVPDHSWSSISRLHAGQPV